ncbi:MAG: ABC transporter ATP-binding protein [Chitinophagaceae bacterium]|nr:ABC transporter ATP-binding protein [Oligoflexus sp.]
MIDVRSITKHYGEKKAVNNLSFRINEGEIVGLLGLNGAGKSTILKTLGTLLQASEGEAWIAGFSVREQADEVRKHIGYLPDTPPLYDEMSIRTYLEFVAKLKGVPRSSVKKHVEEALDQTNLMAVQHMKLAELSHGFRQRTNIAQALVHRPKVLIFDEPINGLDPVQIVEMRDLILSLKERHTVILSSHILSEITRTCDRILVIDQGTLVAEGTEEQLRGKVQDEFDVRLELTHEPPLLLSSLQNMNGIKDVIRINSTTLSLLCREELRPEIARVVYESGAGLLTLQRKEAELETLFLKLVRGENDRL